MASKPLPRLHKNLVAAVVEVLETAFGQELYVDKVLEQKLKANRKWGSRDRGFVAETTYEMVRWWRLLWALYGKEASLKPKELYKLFGIYWLWKGSQLPDWPPFSGLEKFDIEAAQDYLPKNTAVLQSYPDWLEKLASEDLGEDWQRVAAELNREAKLILRTNILKTTREEVIKAFADEKAEATPLPWNDVGVVLDQKINTFRMEAFQKGFFEVQDGGSQLIAPFLRVEPGMRVIDACAGAGGKSLHLATLMQNKGSLIAMDTAAHKLGELKKRARRNGLHTIETRAIENTKAIKRLEESADRLLLDVPCSGTGVIKRNPDTKWKLKPQHLEKTQKMQRDILQRYSSMLKPGGLMVYATCSILKNENEDQVAHFLKQNADFKLIEEKRLHPGPWNDGFYMALVQRGES